MEISFMFYIPVLSPSLSLCHFLRKPQFSMLKDRMWLLCDQSFKQVGRKSSMKKRPGCSDGQLVAPVTAAQGSTFSLWASGSLSQVAENPAVGSWFSSISPGWRSGKANSFPICLRGEMPNYVPCFWFPSGRLAPGPELSSPPSLQRHRLLESLSHCHSPTLPEHMGARGPLPPQNADRQWLSAPVQSHPIPPPWDQNGERQEYSGWPEERCSAQNSS